MVIIESLNKFTTFSEGIEIDELISSRGCKHIPISSKEFDKDGVFFQTRAKIIWDPYPESFCISPPDRILNSIYDFEMRVLQIIGDESEKYFGKFIPHDIIKKENFVSVTGNDKKFLKLKISEELGISPNKGDLVDIIVGFRKFYIGRNKKVNLFLCIEKIRKIEENNYAFLDD